MQKRASQVLQIKVWGRNACFTRPEMKVERVSYDVVTPSAARGILEAILWKPAIQWHITRVDVLKPIRWESVRRNEVGTKMSPQSHGLFIEDERQQRAGLILRDVEYTIHAFFELTSEAGKEDNITKFHEMFLRRAQKGQCFHRPYLGCREFSADFEPIVENNPLPDPIDMSKDLGWMFYDMDFTKKEPTPRFFYASLDRGIIKVPNYDSAQVR